MQTNGLYEEVIIAGFGGQGIILLGKLLAHTAMVHGHEVTYMPAYGAEVRGGTANCMVVIADQPIASPLVTDPDGLIVLNKASFDKFAPRLKTGGLLIMNSNLINEKPARDDITALALPADDIAAELKSPRSANMVALGAYLQMRQILDPNTATQSLSEILAPRYHNTLDVNKQAIQRGAQFAQDNSK